MNCLAHGEFEQAVEHLHRYFDYAVHVSQQNFENLLPEPSAAENPPKTFSLLPYATLNLAGLHFRFGNINYASNLIHETVQFFKEYSVQFSREVFVLTFYRLELPKNEMTNSA